MNPSELTLSLVVIRADDPERLRDFYSALGFRFVREQHGAGPIHHACEVGTFVFEIYPRKQDEPSTSGTRLGFTVPSLDRALQACQRASNFDQQPALKIDQGFSALFLI